MATSDADVICMGEVVLEFVATEQDVGLGDVQTWKAVPGGAPANVAVALQRLGCLSAAFVGCVGGSTSDPFGKKLKDMFEKEGVDTSFLCFCSDEDIRTTLVFTAVWEDGHKELCFYRGADRFLRKESIPTESIFENARCFHYGSITLIDPPASDAQMCTMQMARFDKGLFVTYDPNYRPTLWRPNDESTAHRVIFDAFRFAHMAKISLEEFRVATGYDPADDDDLKAGIQAVLDQGVELVVISRGEGGALASNGDFIVESPALLLADDIDIVETTGAGDGFMAAMISKMLPEFEKHGGSLKSVAKDTVQAALDYANVVGGLTCTKAGAIAALPTAREVDNFLEKQRQKHQSSGLTTTDLPRTTAAAVELAGMIDHTLLKPYCAQHNDIAKLCQEARKYGFAMVAVNPAEVEQCSKLLKGSVRVGAAIGFPLGQTTCAVKAYETRDAIQRGATEIDVVMNVRELQKENYDLVQHEIERVVQVCQESSSTCGSKVLCKIILETCYLTNSEVEKACRICRDAGVDFVKTSTGFGPAGATVECVKLMRRTVGNTIGVKASGGIRDLATARAMIEAGANRIGTSSGVAIIEELLNEGTECD